MDKETKIVIVFQFICVLFLVAGYAMGFDVWKNKYNKELEINKQLKLEYDELKSNYDGIETEYKWQLESCYQQLGDLQDNPYDIDRDGEITAVDYVKAEKIKQAIKEHIMSTESEE